MSAGWASLALAAAAPVPDLPASRQRQTISSPRTGFTAIDDELTRRAGGAVSDAEQLGLPTVYACVRVIAHTVEQLPLVHTVGPDERPLPEWVRAPETYSDWTQQQLVELWTADLATRGHAHAWWTGAQIEPVDPDAVSLTVTRDTRGRPRRVYRVNGEQVPPASWARAGLLHMPFLQTSRDLLGLGPLQTAREAMAGYLTVERYALGVFDAGTHSGGVLESDAELTVATAERYQQRWVENRRRGLVPVLGHGLRYRNELVNPRDAQWLESRTWQAQEVARMYGVPMRYLGLPSGDATTYATARDNDAHYLRSCVTAYTETISTGLSRLLGPGRGAADAARIRFDFDAWLDVVDDLPAAPSPAPTPPGVTP